MTAFGPDSSMVARVEPSPNFDERVGGVRPDMIVLHYTGMLWTQDAIQRLCDLKARVSSHYVVIETGTVVQLVPEAKRAWHAGVSTWNGQDDINSRSIGIEICNPGHEFGYPDYPGRQIASVIALCRGIMTRNVVRPENVVAHSDVAPSRKQDPGEKFPWNRLALFGIGLWVEPVPITDGAKLGPGQSGDAVGELQSLLTAYGYGIEHTSKYDIPTVDVVTAFQRHFRQAKVDGIADVSTLATLRKLLVARDQPAPRNEPKPVATKKQAKPEDPDTMVVGGLFGHPLTPES